MYLILVSYRFISVCSTQNILKIVVVLNIPSVWIIFFISFSTVVSAQANMNVITSSATGKGFCFLQNSSKCQWSQVMPNLILMLFLTPKLLTGAAHNGQVCSTWGNFHYNTFDGDYFQLPYGCNYILATMCDSTQSGFNIQMRRKYINDLPKITSFTIKLEGIVIILLQDTITVNDKPWVLLSLSRYLWIASVLWVHLLRLYHCQVPFFYLKPYLCLCDV